MGLLHRPFIAIAAQGSSRHIGASAAQEKDFVTKWQSPIAGSSLAAADVVTCRE
jgi:hypothetical protein